MISMIYSKFNSSTHTIQMILLKSLKNLCYKHPQWRKQALFLNLHAHFSSSDKAKPGETQLPITQNELQNNQLQKAVISMFVLKFCRNINERFYVTQNMSIREALINQQYLKQFMVKQINKKRSTFWKTADLVDLQWLDKKLKKENYEEVLKIFQINQGFQLNEKIWNQDRMSQVSFGSKVTLNPLVLYKFYFDRLVQKRRYLISGDKGIGKSFSFMTYSHLSSFYHQLPFQIEKKEEQFIEEFTSCWEMKNLSRIVYINASHRFNLGLYFEQLIHQFSGIYSAQKILADNPSIIRKNMGEYVVTLDQMSSVLSQLFKKIGQKKKSFVLIIDQANKILRLIRQILKMIKAQRVQILLAKDGSAKQPHKFRESQQYKDLVQYNEIIKLFITHFQNIIFHSSQQYEYHLLNQFTQSQKKDLDIIDFLLKTERIKRLIFQRYNYSDFSRRVTAQIQLYKIFFFEIEVICKIHNFPFDITMLKQVFDSTFLLNSTEKATKVEKWKNDVRFLHIRQYLKPQGASIGRILQGIMDIKSQQERRIKLSQYFIELKANIQKQRLQNLVLQNIFLNYVTKATSYQKSLQRHFFMLNLNQLVIKEIQRCSKSQQTEPNEFIYVNDNMPPDEKDMLCRTISFGYFDKERNALVFQFSPSNMLRILTKITFTKEYNEALTYLVNSLWLQNQNFNTFFGSMLDNLSYLIFKSGKFSISINDAYNNQPKQFAIENSQSFIGFNNFTFKEPFDYFEKCNSLANSNPGTWIAGYPEKSGAFLANNSLFDDILIKRTQNGYDMIAFDWTFGMIENKNSKAQHYQKIQKFFKKVSNEQAINLTIYVVAPKYIALDYAQKNRRDLFFAYQLEKPIGSPNINHRYTYKLAYFGQNLPFSPPPKDLLQMTSNLLKEVYRRNQRQWQKKGLKQNL